MCFHTVKNYYDYHNIFFRKFKNNIILNWDI